MKLRHLMSKSKCKRYAMSAKNRAEWTTPRQQQHQDRYDTKCQLGVAPLVVAAAERQSVSETEETKARSRIDRFGYFSPSFLLPS